MTVTDDVAPITGPVADGGVTNDARPAIALGLSGPLLAGETLSLFRDGGATAVATATSGSTLAFTEPSALTDGAHTYSASIVNAAGNTTTLDLNGAAAGTVFSFTVDTVAPTQGLLSFIVTDDVLPTTGPIAAGGTTNDTQPSVTLTLDAVLGTGETLRLFRDGGATAVASAGSGATLTFTEPAALSTGSHTYSASIVDGAGNVTTIDLNGTSAGVLFTFTIA